MLIILDTTHLTRLEGESGFRITITGFTKIFNGNKINLDLKLKEILQKNSLFIMCNNRINLIFKKFFDIIFI